MCLFHNITQRKKFNQNEAYLLGVWGGWVGEGYTVMKYNDGTPCGGDVHRSTTVEISRAVPPSIAATDGTESDDNTNDESWRTWPTTEMREVTEPSPCQYVVKLEFAFDHDDANDTTANESVQVVDAQPESNRENDSNEVGTSDNSAVEIEAVTEANVDTDPVDEDANINQDQNRELDTSDEEFVRGLEHSNANSGAKIDEDSNEDTRREEESGITNKPSIHTVSDGETVISTEVENDETASASDSNTELLLVRDGTCASKAEVDILRQTGVHVQNAVDSLTSEIHDLKALLMALLTSPQGTEIGNIIKEFELADL